MRFIDKTTIDPKVGDIEFDLSQNSLSVWTGTQWCRIETIETIDCKSTMKDPLVRLCPSCGAPVVSNQEYCPYCDVPYPMKCVH